VGTLFGVVVLTIGGLFLPLCLCGVDMGDLDARGKCQVISCDCLDFITDNFNEVSYDFDSSLDCPQIKCRFLPRRCMNASASILGGSIRYFVRTPSPNTVLEIATNDVVVFIPCVLVLLPILALTSRQQNDREEWCPTMVCVCSNSWLCHNNSG
jgi:hypothetical protein